MPVNRRSVDVGERGRDVAVPSHVRIRMQLVGRRSRRNGDLEVAQAAPPEDVVVRFWSEVLVRRDVEGVKGTVVCAAGLRERLMPTRRLERTPLPAVFGRRRREDWRLILRLATSSVRVGVRGGERGRTCVGRVGFVTSLPVGVVLRRPGRDGAVLPSLLRSITSFASYRVELRAVTSNETAGRVAKERETSQHIVKAGKSGRDIRENDEASRRRPPLT